LLVPAFALGGGVVVVHRESLVRVNSEKNSKMTFYTVDFRQWLVGVGLRGA